MARAGTAGEIQEIADINAEFRFPSERLHTLKMHVLDLLRWSLVMPNTKLVNDGTEAAPVQVQVPRTTSVTDPLIQDQ